jgi:hypothetical protein
VVRAQSDQVRGDRVALPGFVRVLRVHPADDVGRREHTLCFVEHLSNCFAACHERVSHRMLGQHRPSRSSHDPRRRERAAREWVPPAHNSCEHSLTSVTAYRDRCSPGESERSVPEARGWSGRHSEHRIHKLLAAILRVDSSVTEHYGEIARLDEVTRLPRCGPRQRDRPRRTLTGDCATSKAHELP